MKNFLGNVFAVVVGNLLTFSLGVILICIILLFSLAGSLFQGSKLKDGSVLEITFEKPINESSMDEEFGLFSSSSDKSVYFRDIIRTIEAAADDDKIRGISLKVESFSGGTSQLTDIRNALNEFKNSGKFIYAYTHNTSQSSYILSTVADSLFQNPLGMIFFQGLNAEVMFYKNLSDKYGIDFQVIRHGEYKSAVEPFLRDDLSDENREQLTLLLNDFWSNISDKVAASRNMTTEQLNHYTDSLFAFNPSSALKYKLVDKLVAESEYDQALVNRLKLKGSEDENIEDVLDKHIISFEDYAATLKKESHKDKVAVLYASGTIMSGDGYTGIQSEVYKEAIRKLKDDKQVKAVVLRVNSPGGSADAAEEILYELRQLRKSKPVIVSFGDIAASGGYYIAMESDSIIANPNTLTGSIGVLGMIPSVKKMVNSIGITTDYVNTNKNSDFLRSIMKPMTETGMKTMTEMTENVYSVFVNHVMSNREMTYEQVDSIGGGRIWSGTRALEIGLIDSFGTLEDAIQAAAFKAELDKYSVSSYPFKKNDLETILKEYGMVKSQAFVESELGSEYYGIYRDLKAIKENKGVQLRMPFGINIK